jgi:mannosyltransferase
MSMQTAETVPVETGGTWAPLVVRRTSRLARVLSPDVLIWLVVLGGGVLRFYRIDALALWIDEGYSAMFARMPWDEVLGLRGAYDPNPPLYWATEKLFAQVFPEVVAGRYVSWLAGTLTIPVLYLLGRRVANGWVGLAAGVALAVSPLHIWFSQEARHYVPSMLWVALSFWAVAEYYAKPAVKWAVVYGLSVLLAMYTSYSAFYAFVPQGLLLSWIVWRQKKQAVPLVVGLGGAILLYLPWVPQWLKAIEEADPFRVTYLGVSANKVWTHTLALVGLSGRGDYFAGYDPPVWDRWPEWQWLMVVAMVPALVVGAVVLARRWAFGLATALLLFPGVVVVAVGLSIVSPGFAMRTIIYALIGWGLLLGAAIWQGGLPRWVSWLGIGSYFVSLGLASVTLVALYTGAEKQRWQDVAADVAAVEPLGRPVLIVRPLNYTLIDIYQPGALDRVMVTDTAKLAGPDGKGGPDAVWFAYHDTPRFEEYHQQLAALGYERIMHRYYYNPLYFDLYMKPGAHLGDEVAVNGEFVGRAGKADGWVLPERGFELRDKVGGGRELGLQGRSRATLALAGSVYSLYTAEANVRTEGADGKASVEVVCMDAGGVIQARNESTLTGATGAEGRVLRSAILCPAKTAWVAVNMKGVGEGAAWFSGLRLYEGKTAGPPVR